LGAWEYDVATKQVIWSEQTRQIMGVEPNFDPSLEEAFGFYAEEGRPILQQAFEKIVEDGTPYDLELECINRKGQRIRTRSSGRAQMDPNGRVFKVVGIFQDVTELFKAERGMHAFFEFSPDFQATVSFAGRFQAFSPSWTRQLGFSPKELLAMPLRQIVHPDDRDAFDMQFQEVLQGAVASSHQGRIIDHGRATCIERFSKVIASI
ncbi:MAG: PAS domain-containing protein, partial [Microcoleaceae cyanobacterium]